MRTSTPPEWPPIPKASNDYQPWAGTGALTVDFRPAYAVVHRWTIGWQALTPTGALMLIAAA
jgi:hypothetical protein